MIAKIKKWFYQRDKAYIAERAGRHYAEERQLNAQLYFWIFACGYNAGASKQDKDKAWAEICRIVGVEYPAEKKEEKNV